MENNVQIFNSQEFGQVRTVVLDGEPWFVGRDVAEILGYKNPNEAIGEHVDAEDKFLRCDRGSEMLKLFSSLKEMQEKQGRLFIYGLMKSDGYLPVVERGYAA